MCITLVLMAYQKTESRSYAALKIIFSFALLAGLATIAYFVWFGSPSKATVVSVSQGDGGQIAQLSDNQFVASARTEQASTPVAQTQQEEVQPQTEPTLSDKPHVMGLPARWTQTNSVTEANPCEPTLEQVTETYTNAQEVITLYVNGSPTGCDNAIVGDVYYDYDFSADGTSVTANTTNKPPFCTKETNPKCPKGDGKVTVFVGNGSASNPNTLEKNSLTGKTYYFTIVDSGLDADLDTQGATLAQLVESIQIN